jgi:hypothetical protein
MLRSSNIPAFIGNLNDKGYKIDAIVTINQYNSMHAKQTVILTSWLLGIPIFTYGDKKSQKKTINAIFNEKYFKNKNIIICWEHNCIQGLVQNIIEIGPKVKGIKNYKFINPNGNSELPHWDTNNFDSVLHFDENLRFSTFQENIKTCYKEGNNLLTYGVKQSC